MAGLDAQFSMGAVDWLVELCLSDANASSMEMAPELPMKHSQHVVVYSAAACALASVSCFSAWLQNENKVAIIAAVTREGRLAAVAALAMLANASSRVSVREFSEAYERATGFEPDGIDALFALDHFKPDNLIDDLELFASLSSEADRRLVITSAVQAANEWPDKEPMIEILVAVAGALNITGEEIERYWQEQQSASTAKSPSQADIRQPRKKALLNLDPMPFWRMPSARLQPKGVVG